jgi:hypothetical protein
LGGAGALTWQSPFFFFFFFLKKKGIVSKIHHKENEYIN